MSLGKRTHQWRGRSNKRIRKDIPDPFGFDLTPFLDLIDEDRSFGEVSHELKNFITGFGDEGDAKYKEPKKVWKTRSQSGLFVTFGNSPQQVFKSASCMRIANTVCTSFALA